MASTVEQEISRRLDAWNLLQKSPNWPLVTAQEVRDLGLYGGASGVWVDKERTNAVAPEGVAVGLLHTGRHYDDDVDETGILYHYPTTDRPASRDANEIQAIKNANTFGIPIFVIQNLGGAKKVELAWLNDFDDTLRICVLTFHGIMPEQNSFLVKENAFHGEPILFGPRKTTKSEVERAERDPLFKFNILKRFEGRCLITSLDVTEMLDAAHIIPVASGGTEDPNNGLLLAASVHRALDAGLWAINPRTLKIETRPNGPDALRMKLSHVDLSSSSNLLNKEALEFRYEKLFIAGKKQ
jgi:putative restriction endonuclease